MQLAIYGRKLPDADIFPVQELFNILREKNISAKIYLPFYKYLEKRLELGNVQTFERHTELSDVDYLISIGGDGTLLHTLTLVRDSGLPVLGINAGRLGFLAGVPKEEIKNVIQILEKKNYVQEERTLIQLHSDKPIFKENNYALNEFTIHKKESSSMITIHSYLNGDYQNTYWADGLIVATPTGSTAYSLSCGGPVMVPTSNNFVITPVSPHNLSVRPLVVSDEDEISFEIEGRDNFLCTLDSRYETIGSSFQLSVKKAPFTFKLLRLSGNDFLSTLRSKLMWGADTRN